MTLVTLRRAALALPFFAALLHGNTLAQTSSSLPVAADTTLLAAALPSAPLPTAAKPHHVETTLSLGADAQLTAERLSTQQSFDPSAGVTGEFRQSFRSWLGYSVNVGYTRITGHNRLSPPIGGVSTFAIPANLYETSLSYLMQKSLTPKLTGFVTAGGGAVILLPVHRGATAASFVPGNYPSLVPDVIFRPLGVGSIGIDYHYTPRLALRAEYRGLFYKYPDYGFNLGRAITVSSQPTVSLTYTFGAAKKLGADAANKSKVATP